MRMSSSALPLASRLSGKVLVDVPLHCLGAHVAAVRNQICTDPVTVVDGKFCVRFDPGHALGDDARVFCRIAVFLQQNMQFVAKLFVMVFG